MSTDLRSTARPPIDIITSPFARFAKMEAAGGILLLAATAAALVLANSRFEHGYHEIWNTAATLTIGPVSLSVSRHDWVNDGLMAIFFFLVGLEIKRELLIGELSTFKKAAFPFMAALGGSIFPALIYAAVNKGGAGSRGWGIPMATDIAFALGVLALLGGRVPVSLKVFVAALAIVDDIFGVLVIALFYTRQISFVALGLGFLGVAISFGANRMGIRNPVVYALIGVGVWFAVLNSGVHATIAGILLAFTIPARNSIDKEEFLRQGRWLLDQFEHHEVNSAQAHHAIHALEQKCEMIESPLHRIEHSLQPWVSFLIMPIFAFANAGVHILGKVSAAVTHPIAIGVLLGLLLGKPLGITLFAWLATRTGLGTRPAAVSWGQVFGASWLCGIGFTMALFIASLALNDDSLLDMAKIGIMAASLAAGAGGSLLLLRNGKSPSPVKT
ncbi:MAG TPA: Na+/H+ antiporter NhaA [Acidobacteriaceae bacterium]|nr:Na+/H+ antiporter NhaA [Acidobacteriaceae bacterium]